MHEIGDTVTVTHCKNFPRLDGRTGKIEDIDTYSDGTIEYVVRFSQEASDWDWVLSTEVE